MNLKFTELLFLKGSSVIILDAKHIDHIYFDKVLSELITKMLLQNGSYNNNYIGGIMKICLIYPDNDKKCVDTGASCHLGIAYIASFLKKYGYPVDLYDCAPMQIKTNQMIEYSAKN